MKKLLPIACFTLSAAACGAANTSTHHSKAARDVTNATCPKVDGNYRITDCVIGGHRFESGDVVSVAQTGCESIQVSSSYQEYIPDPRPMPGGGPYDMCAIAKIDCEIYGDSSCTLANTKECIAWNNRTPWPVQYKTIKVEAKFPWAKVELNVARQLYSFDGCKVNSRVR